MPRFSPDALPSSTSQKSPLSLITPDHSLIAVFGAYAKTFNQTPGGDSYLQLGVPFAQIPNAQPLMKFVGGTVFEVTVRRVPFDELPEPGKW